MQIFLRAQCSSMVMQENIEKIGLQLNLKFRTHPEVIFRT